jgi:hypothetical protein
LNTSRAVLASSILEWSSSQCRIFTSVRMRPGWGGLMAAVLDAAAE